MELDTGKQQIIKLLKERACLKQDVYSIVEKDFKLFKEQLEATVADIKQEIENQDKRVVIQFIDQGKFEAHIKIAGDVLVFMMHTNVFNFDEKHEVQQLPYVKEDPFRSYCGVIKVYNFLADSFKYKRYHDIGYLIARIFINKDNHFFVEGKRQLGFLYNDFPKAEMSPIYIKAIIEAAIIFAIDFDLLVPSPDSIQEVSLGMKIEQGGTAAIVTGKRLGFQFSNDDKPSIK